VVNKSPISQPPPGFEFESPIKAVDRAPREVELIEDSGEFNSYGQQVTNKANNLVTYKQALLQEPAPDTSTTSTAVTSESLRQLAHESLQIGEILGVKVIGDYEAAISRITKPLKKNKGKKRSAAKQRPE